MAFSLHAWRSWRGCLRCSVRLSMQISHSSKMRGAAIALVVCLVGIWGALHWQYEPRYQGHQLSYWLEELHPTIITINHETLGWTSLIFRNAAAAGAWGEIEKKRHQQEERASQVLKNAGPECFPILLASLTAPVSRGPSLSHRLKTAFRHWTFRRHLVDSMPERDDEEVEVRRGQALTAIVLLGPRAAPLIPELSAISAQEREDSVTRAASFALYEIAPGEFQRVRSPNIARNQQ